MSSPFKDLIRFTKGYNGNPLLKKERTQLEWSPEMRDEYKKCKYDPIYFAERYIKIVNVDKGLIPIELYDYQKEIIEKITNNRRVVVATSRQAGKTTTAAAIILHYILFNDQKTVAILANKGDSAREVLERIKISYESLPSWIQQGVVEWNKGNISLENGSGVLAGTTTSGAIRGKSINLLYIDEAAFVEGWNEFFASVYPTISSGQTTKLLFTSTPNGLNHFHKTFDGAKKGINGYQFIEVPWQRVPGRGEEWKRETLESLDWDYEKFEQEFCVGFVGSSGTLVSGATLKTLVDQIPILQKGGISQYFASEKDHKYVMIADVSRGKGLDYSAAQIIDITTMPYKQVCTYRNNMVTPADYAAELFQLSKMYNDATILVEINDIGGQVADTLYFDFECENLIYTENAGAKGKRISGGFNKAADRGVRTTKTVKAIGCSMLKLLIEQQQLIINDKQTRMELNTFSKKGNSYEAETGCHDDLVMGLVLFGWLSEQQFFKELTDINTLMRLRDKTDKDIEDEMLSFGFMDDGMDSFKTEEVQIQYVGDFGSWLDV